MAYFEEEKKKKKRLEPKEARLKAADYCAYQERSQQQVRDKLYEYGLHYDEVEEILTELIIEGFINEERFAKAFVRGKFRMKGWGRQKILQALRPHKISDYCLKKGFEEIDPDEYYVILQKHAARKFASLRGQSEYMIRGKLRQHLMMKGFEHDLINEAINELLSLP